MSTNLPTPTLLSYLAPAATPTRVRTLSARLTVAAACLYFLFSLALFAVILNDAIRSIAPTMTLTDLIKLFNFIVKMHWFGCGAILFFIIVGTALLIAAHHIKHARKKACAFSRLALFPLMPILMILATILGLTASTFFYLDRRPYGLFLFIPAALAALAGLLVRDLRANLLWIAQNPITEKPPTPFLPIASQQNP